MALQPANSVYDVEIRKGDGRDSFPEGIVMSKELPFIVLCVEEYKNHKHITGKEVIELFNKYSVCEYIRTFYDVLHTTGIRYIIEDIDDYILSRQTA